MSSRRFSRLLPALASSLALAISVAIPAFAQGKPDFAIRGPRATALPVAPTRLPPGQQRALDDLRGAAGKDVVVKWSALTGAPSRIHKNGKPLGPPSQASPQA